MCSVVFLARKEEGYEHLKKGLQQPSRQELFIPPSTRNYLRAPPQTILILPPKPRPVLHTMQRFCQRQQNIVMVDYSYRVLGFTSAADR
jgi:hypothetical protein